MFQREKEEDKEAKSEGLLHSTLSTHMNTALRQVNEKDRKRFASALVSYFIHHS